MKHIDTAELLSAIADAEASGDIVLTDTLDLAPDPPTSLDQLCPYPTDWVRRNCRLCQLRDTCELADDASPANVVPCWQDGSWETRDCATCPRRALCSFA